ncbi:SusC/RagA family TonB-linked outer membrane protein [Flavobacterium sp. WC2430]|uniref:SusC/RagA family TonB-linked outer membrane protein n=1 Tax=Flavobacterium sp. WC2430 TaxID=3234137 RepID=UPI003466E038
MKKLLSNFIHWKLNYHKFPLMLFLLLTSSFMFAQTSISGVVRDASGPVPGVNVAVKGVNNGTTTDFDGNFKLNGVKPNDVLIFSYIGYVSQEVGVNGKSKINVTLQTDSKQLEEVVVVAYGKTTKKDLTGAVGIINSESLNSTPVTSVDQALQGKVAGLQITQDSGAPGSGMSVNIRGVGSFGSTAPLYIVDGYPTEDISYLNPNDIQSISILKDASASALYGVRASNGVVIVQTKSGKKGATVVEVNSWISTSDLHKKVDLLNVNQFATLANSLGTAQGVSTLPEWANGGTGLTNVDWQDYAFRAAVRQGHNVSIRGGGEKTKIALTAGLTDEEGIVIGSSSKKWNLGLKGDFDITDKLRAKANIKYNKQSTYTPLGGGYDNLAKVFTNVPYLSNATGTNLPYSNGLYGSFTDVSQFATSTNILAQGLSQDNDNAKYTTQANFGLEYDIIPGLTAKANYGFTTISDNYAQFLPSYFRSSANADNRANATYTVTHNLYNDWVAEGLLDYTKSFGKSKINLLGGVSAQRGTSEILSTRGSSFLSNDIRDLSAAGKIDYTNAYTRTSTLASQFARFNYSYDSKYYVTLTARRDGVGDRFLEKPYSPFYSAGAGWNIDEEAFMDDSIFNVLKLRGSYGETGNYKGIGSFLYKTIYANGVNGDDAGYTFGGQLSPGLAPTGLANSKLKWETQVQTDLGIDGELFDGKIFFTVDYFNKESRDFLLYQTIPAQTGFTTGPVNAGNIVNRGLEFLVGYRKNKGDFTWDISANLTTIHNEITSLGGEDFVKFSSTFAPSFVDNWQDITRSYVGGNVGAFYGYKTDGIFQTQAEIDALNSSAGGVYQNSATVPGDRKFKDVNGDGKITADDKTVIGSPIPKFYGGLNFNAKYKNFTVGIDVNGSFGNKILNYTRVEQESFGGFGINNGYTNISVDYFNNYWRGDGTTNEYARATLIDSNQNNRASDHFIEDGSYVRLRNLKFGYSLPDSIIKNLGMTNLNVYVSGQNLITLTKYTGWDPEIGQVSDQNGTSGGVQTRGIDFGTFPVAKSFTLGLNLQF